MSNTVFGSRGPGLLSPGALVPPRRGYGGVVASGMGAGYGEAKEDVTEQSLQRLEAQSAWRSKQIVESRAAARVRWAYTHQPAYSGCVDWITSAIMCNGDDPEKRGWALEPARDRNDQPIKSPDESQLEPFFQFVENCTYERSFYQLLAPVVADWVAASTVYAEVALSKILNRYGKRQPGALYLFPQGEIYNVIDSDTGELDSVTPFAQVRAKRPTIRYTWDEVLYIVHGTMRAEGLNPMTPIDAIINTVKASTAAQAFIGDYFINGGRVGQTFKNPTWEREEALQFVNDFTTNFLGKGNSHKPFAIWGDTEMDVLPSGFTEFAQFIAVVMASLADTCRRFEIDQRLVGAQNGGSSLANKSDRQQIYQEALLGPVNTRKREFSEAFTRQILLEGLGITDWRFVLPTYPRGVDTEKIAAVAAGWSVSAATGVVFPKQRPSDLAVMRKQLDPSLDIVTAEEFTTLTAPAVAEPVPGEVTPEGAPAPVEVVQDLALNGAQVAALAEIVKDVSNKALPAVAALEMIAAAFPAIPAEKVKKMIDAAASFEPAQEPAPAPAPRQEPAPEPVRGERAKRGGTGKERPDAREARQVMDDWTEEASAAVLTKLTTAGAKSVETLKGIYRNAMADGFSDSEKAAFDAWLKHPLPAAGQAAAHLRKLAKEHYKTAKEQALAQIGKAGKTAKGRRSATSDATPGGIDNILEAFGAEAFDEIYREITTSQRKLFLLGLRKGWDVQFFADKVLKRTSGVTEAQVKAIIRTASTDVFNIGRQNAAEDAGLDAYLYSAIMDDRTAEVCATLNGLYLGIHDPAVDEVRPPNHFNCRCILSFVLPGEVWETDRAQLAKGLALKPEDF